MPAWKLSNLAHLASWCTWGVAALATVGVIARPFKLPEAFWAGLGAVLLVSLGLLPVEAALEGIGKGTDVYLFLIGMMLLAELARETGLFDWLAAQAACHARGSAERLFTLIYLVGLAVTVFLSNDATAVVLTPAVAAVTRSARVANPMPYLLVCAFIANAASFVLPISNPANLVIYANHMPALPQWLRLFTVPSVLAIVSTYVALKLTQRRWMCQELTAQVASARLSSEGITAGAAIILTAVVLMLSSAAGWRLGLPTFLCGAVDLMLVSFARRAVPWCSLRRISWGVIPLVAGLFVLVEGLNHSGLTGVLSAWLGRAAQSSPQAAAGEAGVIVGLVSNLVNNLPAGLIAGTTVQMAAAQGNLAGAILIGVDVGPNLSVTGSLATLLWLTALRREGLHVSGGQFFRLGLLVMPPALLLSLGALILSS